MPPRRNPAAASSSPDEEEEEEEEAELDVTFPYLSLPEPQALRLRSSLEAYISAQGNGSTAKAVAMLPLITKALCGEMKQGSETAVKDGSGGWRASFLDGDLNAADAATRATKEFKVRRAALSVGPLAAPHPGPPTQRATPGNA